MPKRYRIQLCLYDEDDQQLAELSHEEDYKDDAQALKKFQAKELAARNAGKQPE